jgi:uncharacterized protein (DUF2062 family)
VAIATFVAFTPTIGAQMVIAVAIAAALRANKAVCIPIVWITNPFTAVPIYSFCWMIGARIVDAENGANFHAVVERITEVATVHHWFHLLEWSFWSSVLALLVDLGVELWLGGCILGLVSGVVLYGLTRWGVTVYRRRRTERKMRRDARRQRSFIKGARPSTLVGCRESA